MRNQSGCIRLGVLFFLLLSVLTLIATGIFIFLDNISHQTRKVRWLNTPPLVTVREPIPGTTIPVGSYLQVSSTATGVRPIVKMELWVDGVLEETQPSEAPTGISPFYADFSLLMSSEGLHLLTIRAIDATGIIGKSPMVSIVGEAKPTTTYLSVQLEEGQTLGGLASMYRTQSDTLHELNPGLGNSPAAGSMVKVPMPADDKGSDPGSPPPPASPGGGVPIAIPDVPMMQIMSERSPGLSPGGPFIPEPLKADLTPPAAPTELQVEVKDCKVTIRWNDNADDEEYYYLYVVPVTYHGFAVPFAYLKPSPATGPAWHDFQPPQGSSLNIWVEAANNYGSQPSNDVWVYIPYGSGCSPALASRLTITFLDMTIEGDLDKAYCYISLESAPEQRVPPYFFDFIQIEGGKSKSMPFKLSFTIPIPKDGKVDVSGECDGWSGDSFKYLGTFNAGLGSETWNGERQTLQGEGFQISISIKPLPALGGTEIEAVDPMLPAPYNVIEAAPPNDPLVQSMYPPAKMLRWKWDGDLSTIDSFQIFLNGQPYNNWSPLKELEKMVQLPGECGQPVRWQVAVKAGTAVSALSTPFAYDLPACQSYLRVRYDNIYFWRTDDGTPGDKCDTLETYFDISVRDVTRAFWNTNFFIPLNCKGQSFKNMTGGPYPSIYGAEPFVITLPLSTGEDLYSVQVKAKFWDSDPTWNPDDLYASFSEHLLGAYVPKIGEKWEMGETWKDTGENTGYSTTDCSTHLTSDKFISEEATAFLNYSFTVYPNKCRDKPPAEGF